MPASEHSRTAAFVSRRGGSWRPARPRKVRLHSISSRIGGECVSMGEEESTRLAIAITRRPCSARRVTWLSMRDFFSSVMGVGLEGVEIEVQRSRTRSTAPLVKTWYKLSLA